MGVCAFCQSLYRTAPFVSNLIIIGLLLLNYLTLHHYSSGGSEIHPIPNHHWIVKRDLENDSLHTPTTQDVPRRERYTFATLLCDDKILQATSVLVYSLKNYARTKHPVTVMVLPNVTSQAKAQLKKLGAQVVETEMLKYPFRVTPQRREQNKPCRYSKLQAWNLTQFDKIVFMDSDMMAVKNLDSIFEEYDELSAVEDAYPGIFNTGIFLLEPNSTTYKDMIAKYMMTESYNIGDQGFLNIYFSETWQPNLSRHLPIEYNVLIKYKDSPFWPVIKNKTKVVHFTAETKPWSMHYAQHPDWRKNSDPGLYFKWVKTRRQIDKMMGHLSPKLKKLNAEIETKCDAEVERIKKNKNNLDKRFNVKDRFSVLLSTFDRVELASKLLKHYSRVRYVDHIFLIWHNPKTKPPPEIEEQAKKAKYPPITILRQTTDSLNNKFNPIEKLRTQAILVVDDDMVVDVRDIEYCFSIWKANPLSIVGNFPRFHRYNGTAFEYHVAEPEVPKNERRYSMMLTKFMFLSSEYLFWYTCIMPECIHAYIDENMNCEDIAMQMLSSGMTKAAPVAVQVRKPVEDYGTVKGISALADHLTNRGDCIGFFYRSFGNRDVLIYNNAVLSRFEKIPFVKILGPQKQNVSSKVKLTSTLKPKTKRKKKRRK